MLFPALAGLSAITSSVAIVSVVTHLSLPHACGTRIISMTKRAHACDFARARETAPLFCCQSFEFCGSPKPFS